MKEVHPMTEAPLLRLCDAQSKLLTALIFEPETAGAAPGVKTRIDIPIAELIGVCDSARDALVSMQTALFMQKINKPYPIALVAKEFLPGMISMLERLRRHLHRESKEGVAVDRLDDFDRAVNRFRASAEGFLMKWPWFDLERMGKAEPSGSPGDLRDASEVLNDLLQQARQRERA